MATPISDNVKMLTARITHEVCRQLNLFYGDAEYRPWQEMNDEEKNRAISGVEMALNDPNLTPEAIHAAWMKTMLADGWRLGEMRDPMKKTHPCIRPYIELDDKDKLKDVLFLAVVRVISNENKA